MRLELLATIREMREWRFGDEEPMWLPPLQRSALELGQHLGVIPRSG